MLLPLAPLKTPSRHQPCNHPHATKFHRSPAWYRIYVHFIPVHQLRTSYGKCTQRFNKCHKQAIIQAEHDSLEQYGTEHEPRSRTVYELFLNNNLLNTLDAFLSKACRRPTPPHPPPQTHILLLVTKWSTCWWLWSLYRRWEREVSTPWQNDQPADDCGHSTEDGNVRSALPDRMINSLCIKIAQ